VGEDEAEARESLIFIDEGEAADYIREEGTDDSKIFAVRATIHFRTMKDTSSELL
jgi:hypothetical protein